MSTVAATWIERIANDRRIGELARMLDAGESCSARGAGGSSPVITAAALHRRTGRPVVLVLAHLDDADEALDELEGLDMAAARFPALETLPGETGVSLELLAERIRLLRRLHDGRPPDVIVAPIHALMQSVPAPGALDELMRIVAPGDRLVLDELCTWLVDRGYRRVDAVESAGEFAVRGGILDVYGPAGAPVRIDLFGDEVEAVFEVDLETMGSDRRLERVEIVAGAADAAAAPAAAAWPADAVAPESLAVLVEPIEINEQGRSYVDRAFDATALSRSSEVFKRLRQRVHAMCDVNQYSPGSEPGRAVTLPVEALPAFDENVGEAVRELAALAAEPRAEVRVLVQNDGEAQRMRELLGEFAPGGAGVEIETRYLHRGFAWRDPAGGSISLVPYHELLHRYQVRRRVRTVAARATDTFLDLQPGDLVVHRDHGIAKFLGLQALEGKAHRDGGGREEFLTLEFAAGAKLHVPASKIELVHRYVGAFKGRPQLSHLGGRAWKGQKEKVSEAVRALAAELLQVQAGREASPGIRYPADTTWQREFEAEFPYPETEDQLAAIAEVKRDMADGRPMDRLICGDVGFGKTEVAIRAAFKAAEYGKQVAVLVPTTVLAEQHERTFRDRFADYPFRIESLSRFKTRKDQGQIIDALRKGQIDIIIGTHRLLSADVRFADLGLVVIDEEQRFGVRHKQRLLAFRMTADVITMSATPIPRTLHMAMLGLRDISSLATPPMDRRAIVTEVIGFERERLRRALERELAREGQVFFVHNRVHDIDEVADEVRRLAPGAKLIVGHGQMPARKLESVMLQFMRRQADILVCTTIIESGIDIPTANTMVINDSHRFGLSELHQLRGRVGRYKHRAYCYLVLPQDRVISEVALKRLRALESFSMLGAGFKIALRDLEIRGAGNLLGPEQSGHIAAVGYEMYCRLLEQQVAELRNERKTSSIDTTIDLGLTGSIPKGYIASAARRMDAYRRISRAERPRELEQVAADLASAYGDPPASTQTLLRLAELRILAADCGIRTIARREGDVVFVTARPKVLEQAFARAQGTLRTVGQPDQHGGVEVYYRPPPAYFEGDSIVTVLIANLRSASPADTPATSGALH